MIRKSTLTRKREAMPKEVRKMLNETKLMRAYNARPPYQRNDYLRWIKGAKMQATREKRLKQMVQELRDGNCYMNMAWHPR